MGRPGAQRGPGAPLKVSVEVGCKVVAVPGLGFGLSSACSRVSAGDSAWPGSLVDSTGPVQACPVRCPCSCHPLPRARRCQGRRPPRWRPRFRCWARALGLGSPAERASTGLALCTLRNTLGLLRAPGDSGGLGSALLVLAFALPLSAALVWRAKKRPHKPREPLRKRHGQGSSPLTCDQPPGCAAREPGAAPTRNGDTAGTNDPGITQHRQSRPFAAS